MEEKIHLSILGCCCSRNMFNYSTLKDIFKVDCYAFQVLPWACFQPKLNIEESKINKIDEPNFTKRMLHYEINKCALDKIAEARSEYILIDLLTSTFDTLQIFYNGITSYIRNAYLDVPLKKLCVLSEFNNLKYNIIPFDKIDENIIFEGIDLLAEWLKNHYDQKKIIIYKPKYAKVYLNNNFEIVNYPDKEKDIFKKREAFNNIITNRLCKILPYANYFTTPENKLVAFERNIQNSPSALHYIPRNFIEQGNIFLKIMNMAPKKLALDLTDLHYEKQYAEVFEQNKILISQNNDVANNYKENVDGNYITFNSLIKILVARGNSTIIISGKDDVSKYFPLINKKLLGLKIIPKFRDSYVAIINLQTKFIYEKNAQGFLSLKHTINDKFVFIESGGYNSGCNRAAIIYEGKNLALNKRGLNICVFDNLTSELLLGCNCDSYGDPGLKIPTETLLSLI